MEWSFEELAALLPWVADDDDLFGEVERVIEAKAAWGTYSPGRVAGVRELAESEWQDAHHADYVNAETVTRGHMVRARSAARGITPAQLWTCGDWASHATEEMFEWFAVNGRTTKRAFLHAYYAQNREPEAVTCSASGATTTSKPMTSGGTTTAAGAVKPARRATVTARTSTRRCRVRRPRKCVSVQPLDGGESPMSETATEVRAVIVQGVDVDKVPTWMSPNGVLHVLTRSGACVTCGRRHNS